MSDKIELLAPAGDLDSLYAAINNGADAVYMGGSKFSARAYASNFTIEQMKEVVDYCHVYGVKVYITLNTLIKQNEMAEVIDYVNELYIMGVDALIVQDIGVIRAVRGYFNDFEIHASTQMTVHNLEASQMLSNLGIKRIVLARELTLEEIKKISSKVETEIFVHGALCVCYSGQCLMSSMIGGRSGNRGRCAQPCRLPYTIINRSTEEQKAGYLLSPKDICTVENIGDIIGSGVKSLKIEGRMKRPEYVAGVVAAYRRAIDNYYSGSINTDKIGDEKRLLQLFNREGFSKGYLLGNHGADMMSYNNPKNAGIILGKVNREGLVELDEGIALKDGIRVGEEGAAVNRILERGKEVDSAEKGAKVKLFPQIYKNGDIIYKTTDDKLNSELKATFVDKFKRKISLNIEVKFKPQEAIILYVEFMGRVFEYCGAVVEKAVNKPLTKESIEDKLRKTGNTPFNIESVSFREYEEGFLSVAALNEVRRAMTIGLSNYVVEKYSRKSNYKGYLEKGIIDQWKNYNTVEIPEYLFSVSNSEQLKALEKLKVKAIAIDLFTRDKDRIDIEKVRTKDIYLKIPNIIRDEFGYIVKFVEKYLPKIRGIITGNLGIIDYFKGKIDILGDYKLNIFNSEAITYIKDYCESAAISLELNRGEIKEAAKNIIRYNYPLQAVVYGRAELMVSEYCPIGSVLGGKSRENVCNGACMSGSHIMRDRMGKDFVVKGDKFCRSHIYNTVPLNLMPYIKELKDIGIRNFRLDFIDESYEETYKVAEAITTSAFNLELGEFTRGHYKRGVE